MFARTHQWDELPSDKVFDFIMTLDERMNGFPDLKKELSFYGAIRCTKKEVSDAVDQHKLLSYYVDVTHDKGRTAYAQMTMDPMNQV